MCPFDGRCFRTRKFAEQPPLSQAATALVQCLATSRSNFVRRACCRLQMGGVAVAMLACPSEEGCVSVSAAAEACPVRPVLWGGPRRRG
jgi:hypothetical protein